MQVLLKGCAGQGITLWYIAIGVLVMFGVDLVNENGIRKNVHWAVRGLAYGLMLVLIIMGAGGGNASAGGFMYAQF